MCRNLFQVTYYYWSPIILFYWLSLIFQGVYLRSLHVLGMHLPSRLHFQLMLPLPRNKFYNFHPHHQIYPHIVSGIQKFRLPHVRYHSLYLKYHQCMPFLLWPIGFPCMFHKIHNGFSQLLYCMFFNLIVFISAFETSFYPLTLFIVKLTMDYVTCSLFLCSIKLYLFRFETPVYPLNPFMSCVSPSPPSFLTIFHELGPKTPYLPFILVPVPWKKRVNYPVLFFSLRPSRIYIR